METTTRENYLGDSFQIETFFSNEFTGRGHWKINCEVIFNGNKKIFTTSTNDSQFIDKLSDMIADNKSGDEFQEFYNERFFDNLEESIIEWCEQINENEEN